MLRIGILKTQSNGEGSCTQLPRQRLYNKDELVKTTKQG
jgi:hypothetical protein